MYKTELIPTTTQYNLNEIAHFLLKERIQKIEF